MKIKRSIASVLAAAVLSAAIPVTGVLHNPLGLTASAVVDYDYDGLYITNNTLRSVSGDVTGISIPSGVTRIAAGAFSGCRALNYIYIPDSVVSINASFSSCPNLVDIDVDSGNRNYSSIDGVLFNKYATELLYYPMGKENSAYYVPYYVDKIRAGAFAGNKFLTEIDFGEGIKNISGLSDCPNLKTITIPRSVTSINGDAFIGCKGITEIFVDPDNTRFSSLDGVLFNKDQTKLIQYTIGKYDQASYSIPRGVTEIGDNAFSYCYGLESIDIPNSVQVIGENAFSNCTELIGLNIPDSVTDIGSGAFSNCTHLKSVNISSGLNTIGSSAFSGCLRLESLTIPEGVSEIGESAFSGCNNLPAATIYGSPKMGLNIFNNGITLYGDKGSSVEQYVLDNQPLGYKFSPLTPQSLKGDVNEDGVVTISDVIMLLSYVVGNAQITGSALENADANDDGKVNIQDVILTLKICVS